MSRGELVGARDIASRLGVTVSAVSKWQARGRIPAPLAVISAVPIWRWRDVLDWAEDTGRVADVDPRFIADARAMLGATRDHVRAEVAAHARALEDLLAPMLVRPPAKLRGDGRGNGRGEWDWWYALSRDERARYSRVYMSDQGVEPDVYAMCVAERVGTDDVDRCTAAWLDAVRAAEAHKRLSTGRTALDVTTASGYDVGELFGPEGARYLARMLEDDAVAAERDAQAEVAAVLGDEVEDF